MEEIQTFYRTAYLAFETTLVDRWYQSAFHEGGRDEEISDPLFTQLPLGRESTYRPVFQHYILGLDTRRTAMCTCTQMMRKKQ